MIGVPVIKQYELFIKYIFSKLRNKKNYNSIGLIGLKIVIYNDSKKTFLCYQFNNDKISLEIVNFFLLVKAASNLLSIVL